MDFTTPPPNFAAVPRPAFGTAAQHLATRPPRTTTKADRRYQRAAKTAAELLARTAATGRGGPRADARHLRPVPGHQRHRPAAPRTADTCGSRRSVTASGTSRTCATCSKRARPTRSRLTLLVSVFFREHNKELHEWASRELTGSSRV